MSVNAAIGRLTKKSHRHDQCSVMSPPAAGPMIEASPNDAPIIPWYLPRSRGERDIEGGDQRAAHQASEDGRRAAVTAVLRWRAARLGGDGGPGIWVREGGVGPPPFRPGCWAKPPTFPPRSCSRASEGTGIS